MPAAVGWAAWMKFSIEFSMLRSLLCSISGSTAAGTISPNSRHVRVAGHDGLRGGGGWHGHADGSDRGPAWGCAPVRESIAFFKFEILRNCS